MPAEAPTVEKVDLIPLRQISTTHQVRPVNPAHVARIAASMKEHGQELPIVVHVAPGDRTVPYVLGPGRHRLEAALKLGWANIAAIVRPPATPLEIRAEQVRENLERKDLTPLEEGELCEALLTELGGDVAEAAAIMGRGAKWVEQRAALMRLAPKVRARILDGSLPLSHGQLIARLPDAEQQEDVADQVCASVKDGEPAAALHRVRHLVEQRGRDLGYASWELDAVFGEADRACTTCPFNSANTRGLFDGDAPKRGACLEPACFHDKLNLASRAARKSANYLAKESLKPTAANADAARDAREVPFVTIKAVLNMVAHKPARKKGPSAGAQAGAPDKAKDPKHVAAAALDRALVDWRHDLYTALDKALAKRPLACAYVELVSRTPATSYRATLREKAEAATLLAKAGDVTAASLLEVAKRYDARITPDLYELDAAALEVLATAIGAKPKPKPTIEQFLPKPKPAAAPKKTKVRAKRKAA